ncbi:MAG: alpha-galactosidase [Porphyromonas sp.]|nr:alpha-galactosidase [Porphyromonas sp.]
MKKYNIIGIVLCTTLLLTTATLYGQEQKTAPPVMGWSSWNTYRININEALIRQQADAMVRLGLKEVGYQYVNIDDGFFGHRGETGMLQTHPERFPNGLKGIADYIHSLGLKAGIYSDAGANTCGSIWDADPNGVGVGLYRCERQDAQLYFNDWGFDYIKIDYCGAGQQLELDERQRYTEIVETIREVSSRDISINICRWAYPGTWVRDIAASWRISPDINPSWGSVKSIISKNLYLSAFATGGHYNDMDMLEVGRGLSQIEEETHFGIWCIMSSPLLIGCDLTTIPDQTLALISNRELIALNQDPLARQAAVVQYDGLGYVLAKDIETHRGLTRAVALYNPTDTALTISVPLTTLELGGITQVRDLVRQRDEEPVKHKIEYEVPAHGVYILRLKGEYRLEPTRYEAEQAYLHSYEDLGKHRRPVDFVSYPAASGRIVVSNLGGDDENYAEWRHVFSQSGGAYRMTIYYLPADKEKGLVGIREVEDRLIEVTINGETQTIIPCETDRTKGLQSMDIDVILQPGENAIRMGSRRTWLPDIDCFTLTHK